MPNGKNRSNVIPFSKRYWQERTLYQLTKVYTIDSELGKSPCIEWYNVVNLHPVGCTNMM